MAYLVLDLDFTAIADSSRLGEFVDPSHELSRELDATLVHGLQTLQIFLINPTKLAMLLEETLKSYDGLIILTRGAWDESIRDLLADNLTLTAAAAKKLRSCYFHNRLTDQVFFPDIAPHVIAQLAKNIRLEKIIAHYPDLDGKTFVALDDDQEQLTALKTMPHVQVINATTDQPDDSFYQKTLDALKEAQRRELTALCPTKTSTVQPPIISRMASSEKTTVLKRLLPDQQDADAPPTKRPRHISLFADESLDDPESSLAAIKKPTKTL